MTDNFAKKVAADGPVAGEGELGSSAFSPGQVTPAGPPGVGQRWTVARKREVVLRLLRGEPVELLSRQFGLAASRSWFPTTTRAGSWRSRGRDGSDLAMVLGGFPTQRAGLHAAPAGRRLSIGIAAAL